MLKPLLFTAACGFALTAAACAPTSPPIARAALDCPSTQGDLTRTSLAPDGKSCIYATRDGDQVSLRLVAAPGGYQAALASIEQELQGDVLTDKEVVESKAKAAEADAKAAEANAKTASAEATSAAKVARQAAEDALSEAKDAAAEAKDDADSGASTRIDLPGIHINADEKGQANVDVGMVHVNAGEHGATVDVKREVRLRGEALSRERRGFRATYILARDNLKDGWAAIGYEAGGPKVGPITVAVVKAHGDRHDVLDDVKRLVRRNAGV